MTVSQVIRKHIVTGCKAAFTLWDTGTSTLHTKTGLQFKVNAKARCHVLVTQESDFELFTVAFGVFRSRTWVESRRVEHVAGPDLFRTIDAHVS